MVSCRAFERCLAGLDTTVGSRDSRESDPTPPPPPQVVVGAEVAQAVLG